MEVILESIAFPEGPAYASDGGIWLVEKEAGNLIQVQDREVRRHDVGGAPNGIAIGSAGVIWFCDSLENSIRTFCPKSGECATVVGSLPGGQVLKMPNDLAFDKSGNLLFTCPGDRLEDGEGYVCCLNTDGVLHVVYSGMFYPNGLVLSADQRTLYVAETGTHLIWTFTWDSETRLLSDPRKWACVGGPVGPDGMALDSEGFLFVAVYGSGQVKKLNLNGQIVEQITLPGMNPTNCALDAREGRGLLVTEAENGSLLLIPRTEVGVL